MLSRVASSLYWIGRYLERAENVSRLLLVTSELSVEIEGLDDALAQAQWDELLEAVSGPPGTGLDFSRETGLALPYLRMLLLDDANPVSVRHSLGRARENARSIREALTREVFEDLNESHRELERLRRRGLRDPAAAHDEVARTHRSILTALGSIEHTLSRDQGWTFMKLGEAIERTQRTLMVLQAKLPRLAARGESRDLPLLYARWRGLLRSVASLENYRARHGGDLQPQRVVRFLLLEPTAPRSMLCGVSRICGYLERLPRNPGIGEAERVVGRLRAALLYDAAAILEKDVAGFCAESVQQLAVAHETIVRQYFPV
jgi:uncharacterized alpha-E superfamily protein